MTLKQIGFDSLNEDKLSIVAVVILIPSGNWMYTLAYLLVPFLMYLSNNKDINSKVSKVYCILFAIIFCQPFFFETGLGRVMNWGSVGWIYTILFIMLIVDMFGDIRSHRIAMLNGREKYDKSN